MNIETEYNEKKLAILNIAERLFAQKGIEGTSVRDIAQEASVNVAMISYYFGSKDKLIEAVFEQRSIAMTSKLDDVLQNDSLTNLEKAYSIIDDYIDKFINQFEFHRIMMREQMLDRNPVVAEIIYNLKRRNMQLLKKLVQEGQKTGEFKKNIDVMLLTSTLIGTINHMMASKKFYCDMNNLQQLNDEEYNKHIKKKLGNYLKNLFKTTLTNEL